MDVINIKEGGYTPGIVLDKENMIFEFTGKACPEDAGDFYDPILTWIERYCLDPAEETPFVFKLSYFNSASSKIILHIMQKLEQLFQMGHKVSVKWYYYEDDEELYYAGEDFAEILNVPFELSPISV